VPRGLGIHECDIRKANELLGCFDMQVGPNLLVSINGNDDERKATLAGTQGVAQSLDTRCAGRIERQANRNYLSGVLPIAEFCDE
jgi:hypothetical protein